ncbi:retrovirus-related pol polyprotein from transposon TNT 1-94 [Tanacetum coccineum]
MAFDLRLTEDELSWPGNANMAFDLRPTEYVLPWPGNANMAFDLRPMEDVLLWPAEVNVTKCDDEESDLSLATSSSRNASKIWLLDSACSHHITPHREWFINFEEHEEVVYITDKTLLTTHGIGFVRLLNKDGTIVTLKGVRYSPKLKKNLISVGTLESKGFKGRMVVGTVAAITDGDRNSKAVKLCHMCLGHAGEKSLNLLIKQGLLKGLNSCILDYVHSDVWGPSKIRSLGGRHYYVTFVDDFSRRVWVYMLKTKDEVLGVFIKWKKMMETQTCRKIKHLQTDNGGEYKNDLFTKFCEDEGIVRHFTVRHTPQQNGVAKHMNRTLLEKVRCMLSNVGFGKEFWAEAVTYACHLVNRLPSTAIDGKTPFEKWYGKPTTDYDSLHVFGSATKKTIFSRDVTFNESTMLKNVNVEQLDGTPKKVEFESIIIPIDREIDDNSPMVKEDYGEEENQTWELTKLPEGKKPIGCKWVYAKKEGFLGQDDVRYKAKLVAKGYLDLELVQMDVKTTFLHGNLEEEIYMVQPEGFKVTRKVHETILIASQSLDEIEMLKTHLKREFEMKDLGKAKMILGMEIEDMAYPCLYSPKTTKETSSIHYDMLIASQSLDEIEKLKTRLKSEFKMKDLGEAKMILGMKIVRDRKLRKLCLTRKQYLRRVLKRFRYMHNPGKGHWQAVKWILRYIHNTVDVGQAKIYDMAMTEAVKEAIWLQGLLGELRIKQKFATMHSDKILEEGGVRIQKIHTSKNPADMLTKVVAGIKFNYCLDLINVVKT